MTPTTRPPKIMFVINSLEGGGAEHVLATIAREFTLRNLFIDVHLATLDDEEDKYTVPARIVRHRMASKGALAASFFNLFRLLRAERPDVVIAFLTRSNLVAAGIGRLLSIPTIISERVNTSSHFANRRAGGFFKALIRKIYPLADRIICVSGGVSDDLAENFAIPRGKLVTAHNPLDIEEIRKAGSQAPSLSLPQCFLVAVGRLVPNKNPALLIKALARADVPFGLVILGEGPERAALEALTQSLGLQGRVLLPGHVANPYAVVARATGYVSASLAEGFPNALVEAMCLSRPVISTDCDSGPSEILDGRPALKVQACTQAAHGILVPTQDEDAMVEAFRLFADTDVRADYSRRAEARSADFSMDKAVEAYSCIVRAVRHI